MLTHRSQYTLFEYFCFLVLRIFPKICTCCLIFSDHLSAESPQGVCPVGTRRCSMSRNLNYIFFFRFRIVVRRKKSLYFIFFGTFSFSYTTNRIVNTTMHNLLFKTPLSLTTCLFYEVSSSRTNIDLQDSLSS